MTGVGTTFAWNFLMILPASSWVVTHTTMSLMLAMTYPYFPLSRWYFTFNVSARPPSLLVPAMSAGLFPLIGRCVISGLGWFWSRSALSTRDIHHVWDIVAIRSQIWWWSCGDSEVSTWDLVVFPSPHLVTTSVEITCHCLQGLNLWIWCLECTPSTTLRTLYHLEEASSGG